MSGWISLHRKILEWEWYDDINTTRLFIHCLLKANYELKHWKGMPIDRGQFVTSLDKLSSQTGLSVSQIRTCLKKLKSTNEIAIKSHTQHTVITVISYDDYQGNDKRDDKPVTYESQTSDKQIATTNKYNNINKEIKEKERESATATRTKKFVKPTIEEIYSYMQERDYDSRDEAENFYDYWESVGWSRRNGKIKDWRATVRTWLKNAKPISTGEPEFVLDKCFRGIVRCD